MVNKNISDSLKLEKSSGHALQTNTIHVIIHVQILREGPPLLPPMKYQMGFSISLQYNSRQVQSGGKEAPASTFQNINVFSAKDVVVKETKLFNLSKAS